MKKSWLLLVIVVVGLVGCRKQNPFVTQEEVNGYTVTCFDIPEQQPAQGNLKLSDFAENVRIIPLETTEECLIGGYVEYFVGAFGILVLQQENIALFDEQGRFVRIIARQGRGPREFQEIRDFCVDEKNDLLYVLPLYAEGSLKCYHLKDSAYFREVKAAEPANNSVEMLDNGNFLLAPKPVKGVKYYYYEQTGEGELIKGVPYRSGEIRYFTTRRVLRSVKDGFRYVSLNEKFSDDTVFKVTSQGLQPLWVFKSNHLKDYRFYGETPDYLFFTFGVLQNTEESETTNGAKVVTLDYDPHTFCYNKKSGELKAIEGIWDDCFSGKVCSLLETAQLQQGNYFVSVSSAASLLEEDKNRVKADPSVKYPEAWKKLVSRLKEDDNPVLIVGKINL